MTRVHLCALALVALGGCGGIDIDIPEWETGDDGGLDIGGDLAGELDDGWSSDPDDDGGDHGGNDDGDVDDGDVDDGDVDGDDDDGGDVETSVADDGSGEGDHGDDEIGDDEIGDDEIGDDEIGDDEIGDDEIGDDDGGEVGSSDDGTDDGGGVGPCCEAHDGGGCEYPEVAACVCEADPFCCDVVWDELCVVQVDMLDCGVCGSLDEGGTDDGGTDDGMNDDGSTDDGTNDDGMTDGGGGTGACCEAHDAAGCEYPEVEDCVCLVDPFCCDVMWDDLCAAEVEGLACGICS